MVHPHVCGENLQRLRCRPGSQGTPPRVWGKRRLQELEEDKERYTPTCVGKTNTTLAIIRLFPGTPPRVWGKLKMPIAIEGNVEVHPHVCGENQPQVPQDTSLVRYTPTCVGKTAALAPSASAKIGTPPRVWGKLTGILILNAHKEVHPHVCGENLTIPDSGQRVGGTPPRVWGKPPGCSKQRQLSAVHPHVCGENPLRQTPATLP